MFFPPMQRIYEKLQRIGGGIGEVCPYFCVIGSGDDQNDLNPRKPADFHYHFITILQTPIL